MYCANRNYPRQQVWQRPQLHLKHMGVSFPPAARRFVRPPESTAMIREISTRVYITYIFSTVL